MFLNLFSAGMVREPKYSHLKDLHKAIKLCEPAMISSDPEYRYLGPGLEVCLATVYISFLQMEIKLFFFVFESGHYVHL